LVEEIQSNAGKAEICSQKGRPICEKVEAYIALQKHRASDKKIIALSQPYEVQYWSKKFKITPAKLKTAVKLVGHSSKKVGEYLSKPRMAVAKKGNAKK
jgi:Protein of unknown function (DUF3606)